MLVQRVSIIMLALLVPVTSFATVIRQRPYRYSFEAAVAKEDEQFVVCTNCPDNQLTLLPVTQKLSVRLTFPEPPAVPAIQQDPEVQHQKGETSQFTGRTATVLFAFDSAQLSWHERERLTELVKGLPKTSTFDLTGYTCTIGTDAYNERLALNRAKQVAAFLTTGGLTVGGVTGKGKCCPVSNDKRWNRRVEIRELRKGEQ